MKHLYCFFVYIKDTFSPVVSIHSFIGCRYPICCNAMHWLETRSACVMMWGVTTRRIKGTRLTEPIRSSYGRDRSRRRRTEPRRRASAPNPAEKDASVRRLGARRSRARPSGSGGVGGGGGIIWSVWQPTGRYQLLQKAMPDVHQKQKPRQSKCHLPDAFAVYCNGLWKKNAFNRILRLPLVQQSRSHLQMWINKVVLQLKISIGNVRGSFWHKTVLRKDTAQRWEHYLAAPRANS